MDDRLRDPEDRRAARRRLLKGSFSAPAMLILPSGSAWAASSSRCVANDAAQKNFPGIQTGATYLQVQIYKFEKGGTTSFWVKGSELKSLASTFGVACNWINQNGAVQHLCMQGGKAGGGKTYVAGNIYDSTTVPPAPTTLATHTGYFYAVSVDTSGNIVGVDKVIKTGTGGAVHMSCWSSFF